MKKINENTKKNEMIDNLNENIEQRYNESGELDALKKEGLEMPGQVSVSKRVAITQAKRLEEISTWIEKAMLTKEDKKLYNQLMVERNNRVIKVTQANNKAIIIMAEEQSEAIQKIAKILSAQMQAGVFGNAARELRSSFLQLMFDFERETDEFNHFVRDTEQMIEGETSERIRKRMTRSIDKADKNWEKITDGMFDEARRIIKKLYK